MDTTRLCPQCQQPLAADAPDGLCPQCLMQAASGPAPSASGVGLPADIIDIGDPAEVAKKLPQFEILELLGRGGMGVVYKARQLQLDRLVALKILPPVDALSPDFIARFTREARALAKLNHPNIVNVYDFGETGGLYWIIMEFVDGANLRQLLEARKLTPAEALAIVPKICDALEYAHEEGLVHRDIKPENLLIDKKGRVKIADFGLAKLLRREPLDMTLTLSGMALGTLRYMAPEQMDKPETVDHRADLYSLGVVIYEMLTGETPVGRFELPSQKAQVDVRFDEIVLHALEREPARRYQHASEVREDVEKVTSKPSAPASPQIRVPSSTEPRSENGSASDRTVRRALMSMAFAAVAFGVMHVGQIVFWTQVHTSYSSDANGRLVNPRAPDPAHRPNGRFLVLDLIAAAAAGLVIWRIGTRNQEAPATSAATLPIPASDAGKETNSEGRESGVGETPGTKPPTRHLLSAFLVLIMLAGFFFGFSFQAKHSGTTAGMTKIITVGAVDPLYTSESGPSGFQTGFNFFSWSFFALVVCGIAFGALWRIGREDQGKVPRDPAWWRDWWKQVGVWGGLLLIACIVRTVMHPDQVLMPPGQRAVDARFVPSQTGEKNVTYLEGHTSAVKAVAVSPDGRTLVSAGLDGRVLVRELPSGKLRRTAVASSHPKSEPLARLRTAVISPDSQRVVVGGDMRELQSIHLFQNQIDLLQVPNDAGATIGNLMNAGGNKLAYITAHDAEIVYYDTVEQRVVTRAPIHPGQSNYLGRAAASPDGQFIAITTAQLLPKQNDPSTSEAVAPFQLTVFDKTGAERLLWEFADSADFVYSQVVFTDARTLAVCLPSGKMQRWMLDDAGKWQVAAESVRIVPGRYTATAASRDGKTIWLAEGNQITGIDATT
jgi:serine/threonine protein kinase